MNKLPILVVDDSDFERRVLRKALSIRGQFETIEANSGEQCLEVLNRRKVGIVLMDIMMPGIHGTDVLKTIRETFNPIELPIIMITAKSEVSDVVACLKNGANDYITKPVNFEVAISRVSTHLKLSEISNEMSRLKEIAALDAIIATYSHEINNPLAIALGCLNSPLKDEAILEKLKTSLWRIADIVKKIQSVREKREAEYQESVDSTKMIKIR